MMMSALLHSALNYDGVCRAAPALPGPAKYTRQDLYIKIVELQGIEPTVSNSLNI